MARLKLMVDSPLRSSQLTLLLPFATPASSVEITPEVVREHLVFATGGTSESSETTPALVVTLSGLVGTMSRCVRAREAPSKRAPLT